MGRRALPRATGSAAKKETRGKKTRSRSTRAGSAGEGRHRPKPACAPARVTCPQAAFLHRPTQGVQRHEEGARDHGHRPGGDMVGYWRVGSVLFCSWLAGSERTKQRRVFRRCIRPLTCRRNIARVRGYHHGQERQGLSVRLLPPCSLLFRARDPSPWCELCPFLRCPPQWSSRFSATDDEDRDDWIMAIEKAQQSSNIDVAANSVSPARFIAQHLHRPCDPAIRQPCDPVC